MTLLHWVCLLTSIVVLVVLVIAIVSVMVSRRQMRKQYTNLRELLDKAASGSLLEKDFDESELSVIESKMVQFLSSCKISSQDIMKEKLKIQEFISDISHQTKTPLANIILYSQLLSEADLPSEEKQNIEIIATQAEKLKFLVEGLVKVSRLETGIIKLDVQQSSVQELLANVMQQAYAKASDKSIMMDMLPTDEEAYFDIKWVGEAIYNILDNAIKYSPRKSKIRIQVIRYEIFCRIDISDEGIGIAEGEYNKIFARFYRSQEVSKYEGVGIGLFLAREILIANGGYIKVSSKLGRGSTFSVFLPTGN